nr:DUF397 domain-containing protein [Streptomyces sp. SCSIO ZS0520]
MMRHNLPETEWQKSSYSLDNGGQCVERQTTSEGLITAGDSKNRPLGAHTFPAEIWQEFITAVARGAL